MSILLIAVLLIGAIGIYVFIHNAWVLEEREQILRDKTVPRLRALENYDALLSFHEMCNKWWVWDINKLKR